MTAFFGSLLLILLLTAGLYAAAFYLLAIEPLLADFFECRRLPSWNGWRGVVRPFRTGMLLVVQSRETVSRPDVGEPGALLASSAVLANAWQGRWLSIVSLWLVTLLFVVVPFGPEFAFGDGQESAAPMIVAPMDAGLFFFLAVYSLWVYCLVWQTGEDLGGEAQGMAVFVPFALSVLGVVLLSGSLRLSEIARSQGDAGMWWIVIQPLGLALFLASGLIEPAGFGGAAKSQAAGGAGMKPPMSGDRGSSARTATGFAQLAETLRLIAMAYVVVILFGGGWHVWGITPAVADRPLTMGEALFGMLLLQFKVMSVLFSIAWLRWILSRSDRPAWWEPVQRSLLPMAAVNLLSVAAVREFAGARSFLLQGAISWGLLAVWVAAAVAVSKGGISQTSAGEV